MTETRQEEMRQRLKKEEEKKEKNRAKEEKKPRFSDEFKEESSFLSCVFSLFMQGLLPADPKHPALPESINQHHPHYITHNDLGPVGNYITHKNHTALPLMSLQVPNNN